MEIINKNGKSEFVDVVAAFKNKKSNKEYIVYKKDEKNEEGKIAVYVSAVDRLDGTAKLIGVEDDKEWEDVLEILDEMAAEK